VTFIFLTIMCRKFAELYILTPFWAAMLPCLLLAPIGVFLTRRAMNDSQMLNTDRFDRWVRFLTHLVTSPFTFIRSNRA
jgi:lipopolysaccharide export system permease protein